MALQFTALLFTVCACSIQHADESLRAVIQRDLGEHTEPLSEKYHNLARELGSVVPPGYSHLHSCQSMLHSSYWYISQAKYPEAWHALSAAARECQILGEGKANLVYSKNLYTNINPLQDEKRTRRSTNFLPLNAK